MSLSANWSRRRTAAAVTSVNAEQAVTPGSRLDFALRYAAIGWHVFPVWGGKEGKCRCGTECTSPGKHPVEPLARRGYLSATTDPALIRLWWTQDPEAGIGVNLEASSLVAVDIDPRNGGLETIDQVEAEHGPLRSDVMQFTQGGGEHRVFSLAGTCSLPGKLGPGIDLKRSGYIVLAPTQGVLGKYDWEASSDPLEGAVPSPLPDWIRDLQGPAPQPGKPDLFGTRFATPAQVAELREAIAFLDADDRDTWIRCGLALRSLGQAGWSIWTEWSQSSTKFNPVDQIRVWRSFKPAGINFESVFFAAQQQGWVNPLAGMLPPAKPMPEPATAPPDPVQRVFSLPGVLGQVEAWINATSRKPQPMFATQAAIAFGSIILGRRYVTTQRNWPSLYLLNIGKSSSGKEHAKWALERLLDACGLGRLIGPSGYTSDSGVLSTLHGKPAHLAVIDEFGKVLEAASVRHAPRAASTMRALMEVWGRCDGTLRPQGYSTFGLSDQDADAKADKTVINPALTLLGMTTPDTFFDTIGSAAARDGFLNRFLIVESDIGRQVGQGVDPLPVPQTVIDWAREHQEPRNLIEAAALPGVAANARIVAFSPGATLAFAAFERRCLELMDQHDADGLGEMFGRTCEIAMRLSLILAVGNNEQAVSRECAQWAIEYAEHHAIRTANRLKDSVADSDFEALKLQVLACIRKAGPRGLTERDLNKQSRKFRAVDQRQQVNVLNSLAFAADIQRVEFPPASGRGPGRKVWVIAPTDADTAVPS